MYEVVELLIEKGSPIYTQENVYKFTPLHYAAKIGRK